MASSPETVEALDPVTEGWKNLIKSVFHKLRTTVEEDRVRDEQVQSVLQKKDRAQAEIEQLRAQLETARTQRQAELDQKNDTIEKLKGNSEHAISNLSKLYCY
jgi:peptidoglycan hydrolase CwlO-like protein